MNNYLCFLATIILTLTGCKPDRIKKGTSGISMNIDWNTLIDNQSSLSDFLVSYKYVRLETAPDCVMGWMDKIIVRDSTIYILEKANHGRLFMFTLEGRFIRKIDRVGKGPGEYIGIRDIEIPMNNSKIYILTEADNILIYNTIGVFERTLTLSGIPEPVSLWNFVITPEAMGFNITSQSGYSFLATDSDGKFISMSQVVSGIAYVSDQLSQGFHNSTFVKRICDTIFQVTTSGQIKPYLQLDFGKNALTAEEWDNAPRTSNGWSKMISHPYARFNTFYDLKDFFVLVLRFFDGDLEKSYLLLGNTENKHFYCSSLKNFNDYLSHTLNQRLATLPESNVIITSLYPHLLHEALSEYQKNNKNSSKVLDSLCSVTSMDDNPIIAFYKLELNKRVFD